MNRKTCKGVKTDAFKHKEKYMMYCKKYYLITVLVIAAALSAVNFKERSEPFPYYLWFSGGLGLMWTEDAGMTNLYASANFSKNTHVLKLRAIAGGPVMGTNQDEHAGDIGFLYGYRQSFGNINISYLAGIGLTAGEYKGKIDEDFTTYTKYEMIDYQTISLPLEIQLDLNRFRPFGLSLSVFGDLNSEKSFAGLSLSLLLGRLP